MDTTTYIIIGILAFLAIVLVVLFFLGKRAQKKQEEQKGLIEAGKQSFSMLIIDKKRMKVKDSGLPQAAMDQIPKYLRGSKLPIVKAKVGPQIVSLVCDEKIFDSVPTKKEVKAVISGIYIIEVKGLHGKNSTMAPTKKKSWYKRTVEKIQQKGGATPLK